MSIVFAVLAAFVVFQFTARFLNLPMAQRMNVFLDDSFYYMTPALNIAKGLGPTADGITLTSGYHPLWMSVLVVLAWVSRLDKEFFFYTVVIVGSMLHFLSAVFIYLTAARFISAMLAAGLSLMYVTLIRGLLDAIGGTEAALLGLLLSIFLWIEAQPEEHYKPIIRGILMGLVILARTDAIFLALGWLSCTLLYGYMFERKNIQTVIKNCALTVVFTGLVVLPWLIYSFLTYGTIFQQSLLIKQFWRSRLLENSSLVAQLEFSAKMFFNWIRSCLTLYSFIWLLILSFLFGVIYPITTITTQYDLTSPRITSISPVLRMTIAVIALLFYVVSSGMFYAIRFSFVREWYFVAARVLWPAVSIVICAFALSHPVLSETKRRVLQIGMVLGLVYAVGNSAYTALNYLKEYGATRGASQFVIMANYIKENLPQDAIIGAYSSGILSYFSERCVINLDGLANNDILKVVRTRTMDVYLDSRGVRYLADHESITWPGLVVGLPRDGNPKFLTRLKEIYRVPCDSRYGDIVLWEIMPPN